MPSNSSLSGEFPDLAAPPLPRPQQPRSRRFRTLRVIIALILRETGSRESRASLGFLWTIIEPVIAVVILSVCFSIVQRAPRLGTNFPLFYITGVVPFHLFSRVAARVGGSVRYSDRLLGFPSVTVIDVLVSRFLLNFFTNIAVFVILLIGVTQWYGLNINPDLYRVLLSLAMASALGLGVGTMNSVFFLWSPAYESAWSMVMRPMTLFSGVMVQITDLPPPVFNVLKWLPMAHFVAEMRGAFYPASQTFFVDPLYVFAIALGTFLIGLIGLHRYAFDFLERR